VCSQGNFENSKQFRECFNFYKSQVTQLIARYKQSGFHTSGQELIDEVHDKFSGKGKNIDYLTFFCWLEWKDEFENYGWLTRDDVSSSSTNDANHSATELTSPPKKKRGRPSSADDFIGKLTPLLKCDAVDATEVERNVSETGKNKAERLLHQIKGLEYAINNTHNIHPPEKIARWKVRISDLTEELCDM
jgi:hypothetical protein